MGYEDEILTEWSSTSDEDTTRPTRKTKRLYRKTYYARKYIQKHEMLEQLKQNGHESAYENDLSLLKLIHIVENEKDMRSLFKNLIKIGANLRRYLPEHIFRHDLNKVENSDDAETSDEENDEEAENYDNVERETKIDVQPILYGWKQTSSFEQKQNFDTYFNSTKWYTNVCNKMTEDDLIAYAKEHKKWRSQEDCSCSSTVIVNKVVNWGLDSYVLNVTMNKNGDVPKYEYMIDRLFPIPQQHCVYDRFILDTYHGICDVAPLTELAFKTLSSTYDQIYKFPPFTCILYDYPRAMYSLLNFWNNISHDDQNDSLYDYQLTSSEQQWLDEFEPFMLRPNDHISDEQWAKKTEQWKEKKYQNLWRRIHIVIYSQHIIRTFKASAFEQAYVLNVTLKNKGINITMIVNVNFARFMK